MFDLGAKDGFGGVSDKALRKFWAYEQGLSAGRKRYRRFIASTVDHVGLIVESECPPQVDRNLMEESSHWLGAPVSLAEVREAKILSQQSGTTLFADMQRRDEVFGMGGCLTYC